MGTVSQQPISAQQIINVQQIAYLLAIAIAGDGQIFLFARQQKANPTLIFGAFLPFAIDAALVKDVTVFETDTTTAKYSE